MTAPLCDGTATAAPPEDCAPPALTFAVESASAADLAAAPSLRFDVAVESAASVCIQSISLQAQVRIAASRRRYTDDERTALRDLFGEREQWSGATRSLLWTQAAAQVPRFEGRTVVALSAPCTYDFDVTAAKYLTSLDADGAAIPLEFLFSGSVFYSGPDGLRVAQIPWDREARFEMPVRVWRDTMDQYFPNSAWLRLRRETFDRLNRYRVDRGLLGWEEAIDALMDGACEGATS